MNFKNRSNQKRYEQDRHILYFNDTDHSMLRNKQRKGANLCKTEDGSAKIAIVFKNAASGY